MTADHKFKHWMRTLIVLFIVLFFYIIIADRHAPITTEGRVQGYVVQVAPEVSGKVAISQRVVSRFLVSSRLAGMTQLWIHTKYKNIASYVSTSVRHTEQLGTRGFRIYPPCAVDS